MSRPACLHLALLACLVPTAAHAEIALDSVGPFQISLEGLLQSDFNWFDEDRTDLNPGGDNGDDSENEVRRAELILKGKSDKLSWVVGYDAKADKFLDVNLKWKLGAGALQLGQYKQLNSQEELGSTRSGDFISKAMPTSLFAVGRRLGVSWGQEGAHWGYQAGVFGRELTRNLAHGSGFGGRAYLTPWLEDGRWLHFGLSAVDYDTDGDQARLRVRPDADLAVTRLIDSGALRNADRQRTLGLEAAWVDGPWKLQGEYFRSRINRYTTGLASQPGADYTADGWYLSGLWNLSGETWAYKAGTPVTPTATDPQRGLWQLGLRYDAADLDDGAVRGGNEQNWTLGVNWYWHSHVKLSANYVLADSQRFVAAAGRELGDDPNIAELRLQLHW